MQQLVQPSKGSCTRYFEASSLRSWHHQQPMQPSHGITQHDMHQSRPAWEGGAAGGGSIWQGRAGEVKGKGRNRTHRLCHVAGGAAGAHTCVEAQPAAARLPKAVAARVVPLALCGIGVEGSKWVRARVCRRGNDLKVALLTRLHCEFCHGVARTRRRLRRLRELEKLAAGCARAK